ncbi:MAG: hypothetical protein ACOY5W_10755 [Pseudomonadota bacterium]
MSKEALNNLAGIGKLKVEPPARSEFAGLLRSGQHRLHDAEIAALSLESRFDLAYNAAHAFSLAALRWHGYRSESRYLVFQCLQHTLGLSPEQWRVLDQAHRKRNLAEYEGVVDVDRATVEAVIRVTRDLEQRLAALGPPAEG